MHDASERTDLRARLRAWRRTLPAHEQSERSEAVAQQLASTPWWADARRIGLYLAVGGELDVSGAADLAPSGAMCFVPVLHGEGLAFGRLDADEWADNRFGISEPCGPTVAASELDLVVVPAVAVDRRGHRLGMGGGFYDRTFGDAASSGPVLVAAVHDEQLIERVDAEAWDVPVDAIVTPTGLVVVT